MRPANKMPLGAKVSVDQYRNQVKKKSGSGANELTRAVMSYITVKFRNAYVVRINTQGQWDAKKKLWRKSHTRLGTSDLHACINGRFLSIEIKAKNDKMRTEQWLTKADVERAGGLYIIVTNMDEFIDFMDKEFSMT